MVKILRENDPGVPVYHCLGNHDLNLPRQEVVEALRSPAPYFSASLPRGWRLVVLDTTDLNPRYLMPGSEGHSEGLAFFEAAAPSRLLTPWGGGIGSEQMDWLRGTLEEAERNGQRVLVASHCALHPGAAREGFCAWNAEEVAELLEASKAVAICVAGHDHTGGYYTSSGLTHFVTLEAMLEAPQGSNAFCFLEVWPHHVEVRGVGAATSRRLQVTPMQKFSGIAGFGMRIESILGSDNIHMWP